LASARSTFNRLRDDFRADAVTGKHCCFHLFTRKEDHQPNNHGCSMRRRASNARILSAWNSNRPMSSRPFNQAVLAVRIDVERNLRGAVGCDHDLPRQVDGEFVAGGRHSLH